MPMTKREAMLKQLSTYQFAALDLQLYLDTHAGDGRATEQMQRYKQQARTLRQQYEKLYGPLTKSSDDDNQWSWINGPWPWESEGDN